MRLRIAKLKKQVFGSSSEKIEREIQQLELVQEDLLIAAGESNGGQRSMRSVCRAGSRRT
ncbi:transposase [Mesorhizobium sp. M0902]